MSRIADVGPEESWWKYSRVFDLTERTARLLDALVRSRGVLRWDKVDGGYTRNRGRVVLYQLRRAFPDIDIITYPYSGIELTPESKKLLETLLADADRGSVRPDHALAQRQRNEGEK